MSNDELARISIPQRETPQEPAPDKRKAQALGRGLGRGLGALMGELKREEPLAMPGAAGGGAENPAAGGLASLPVAQIEPHPGQPRRHFDEAALDELAQSIARRGVIQPVIVRLLASGRYQLVAGERRWRAAQRARLHEIPALIRSLDDREVTALALIENLQREDLNPVEEAQAFHRLSEDEGLSQADIARMVDKSRSHVANLMRLLALPADVLAMVEDGRLSMGHARALINVPEPAALAQDVIARGLSVRAAERLARKAIRRGEGAGTGEGTPKRSARAGRNPGNDADIAAVQGHLEDFLGLKVTISADSDPSSGAVTIRYRTLDQLDLICQRLTGGGI
jgi:ParB family chromosome partitioning protein